MNRTRLLVWADVCVCVYVVLCFAALHHASSTFSRSDLQGEFFFLPKSSSLLLLVQKVVSPSKKHACMHTCFLPMALAFLTLFLPRYLNVLFRVPALLSSPQRSAAQRPGLFLLLSSSASASASPAVTRCLEFAEFCGKLARTYTLCYPDGVFGDMLFPPPFFFCSLRALTTYTGLGSVRSCDVVWLRGFVLGLGFADTVDSRMRFARCGLVHTYRGEAGFLDSGCVGRVE